MTVKNYDGKVEDVKSVFFTLRQDLVKALENGDEKTVLSLRSAIIEIKDLTSYLVTKSFDATIDYVHTTQGDDAFPNVERIYQPRGRVAGEKKVVDPFAPKATV